MQRQPVGLIFIMNKKSGNVDIEEKLQPFFSEIIKNLVSEKYIETKEQFDKIFDGQFVHFIRLDDKDFQKLEKTEDLIGATAIDVYKAYHDVQPHEDIHVLKYNAKMVPWGFDLYVAVLYEI